MRFLLDTNVLSEPTRQQPHGRVLELLKRHEQDLCTAAPVIHEMAFGIERLEPGRRRQGLSEYMDRILSVPIPVMPYDSQAARWHASERARLEKLGRTAPFVDGQIAAIAAVRQLVLVTGNVQQFGGFVGLQIENWLE